MLYEFFLRMCLVMTKEVSFLKSVLVCAHDVTALFCGASKFCQCFNSAVCVLWCPALWKSFLHWVATHAVSLLYGVLFPFRYILFPCSVNQFFLVLLQTLYPALQTSAFLHSYKLWFLLIKVNLLCLIFIVCNFSACALSMSQIAYSVRYQLIGGVPCLSRCELFTCEHRLWYFCIFW